MIRMPGWELFLRAGRLGALREAFEERCPAVRPVPDAFAARVVTGFGWVDERAREEEAFVTDEP
jgi:hypothetical protein